MYAFVVWSHLIAPNAMLFHFLMRVYYFHCKMVLVLIGPWLQPSADDLSFYIHKHYVSCGLELHNVKARRLGDETVISMLRLTFTDLG